ncbi:MAG: hypothetical protein SFY56_07665 [Bacteroidota bacterium]|nr:hypothetical protein [Bacteroidota bacterium]
MICLTKAVFPQLTKTIYTDNSKQFKAEEYTLNNNGLLNGQYKIFWTEVGLLNKIKFLLNFSNGYLIEETGFFKSGIKSFYKNAKTGIWNSYYEDGKIYYSATLPISKSIGTSTGYLFPNSIDVPHLPEELKKDALHQHTYSNNILIKEIKFYYSNGKLYEHSKYDENGIIKLSSFYDENGILTGKRIRLDTNHFIYQSFNNQKISLTTKYKIIRGSQSNDITLEEIGRLLLKKNNIDTISYFPILNDKINGIAYASYDRDGNLTDIEDSIFYYRKCLMENSKMFGMSHDYYKSGKIQGEGFLINEKPEVYRGKYKGFYESGKLNWEGENDNDGFGIGKYLIYYENGKVSYEAEYENKIRKFFKEYDENGKLTSEAKLKNPSYFKGWLYDYVSYKDNTKEKEGEYYIVENPKDAINNEEGFVNELKYFDEKGKIIKTEIYLKDSPNTLKE